MTDLAAARPRLSAISFRTKITLLSLVATTVGIGLAFALFLLQAWMAERVDFAHERVDLADKAARHAALALEQARPELAKRAIEDFERASDLKSATFYTREGLQFLHWGPNPPPADALDVVSLQGATASYDHHGLEVHAPVVSGDVRLGELVLVSGEESVTRHLLRNCTFGLGLFFFAVTVSTLLASWLCGRALRPLSRLAAGMERVRQTKDLSVLIDPTTKDEFGWLTTRFNALLAELKTNDAALRQALDELTEARDAADTANVMKSQFLANMSHEIRTPLNGVLGMAQVMALNPLADAQSERLDVIRRSGESLLAILNDLLDLSKIEAGKMEIEEAPFDLAELASGAHAAFTSIANSKGVSFDLEIAEGARGVWRGDSVRVRQILYNLISNALKFTSEGEVRVGIQTVPNEGSKALLIRVEDTGIGIAAEKLDNLFDKFVQADSTTTRRFGGTGLGLAICKDLAELMGGTIAVHSLEGQGTCFDVFLPLTWISPETPLPAPQPPTATPDTEADPDDRSAIAGLKVLAAEDNATNQVVLKTILHSMGLEPVIVENGRQAVDTWAQGGFDLILMDIQMPILDGLSATEEIRRIEAEKGLQSIYIVALSANAMTHQVREYLQAGMDAHLAKPIQLEKLYMMLQTFAAERPTRRKANAA